MNLMKKIVLALMAAGMLVAVMLETAPAATGLDVVAPVTALDRDA